MQRVAVSLALLFLPAYLSCLGPDIQQRRVQIQEPGPDQPPHISTEESENSDPRPPTGEVRLSFQEKQFVDLVNAHRQKVGCSPLKLNTKLQKLAEEHSRDMAARDFFSHTNPDGESPFDRMKNLGIRYSIAAENIAYGQRSAREVLQSWLSSSGHRRNIENCRLKEHGIGHFLETNHWTHVFATTR